jgi:hypothetical protein
MTDQLVENILASVGLNGAAPAANNGRDLAGLLLRRSQLADLPQPEPLIDGTLDRRTVALLAGPWGTCKTFIALSWACSVATGSPWFGRTAEQGSVLYVVSEGASGLHRRLEAWESAWQAPVDDTRLHVLPEAVQLMRPGDVTDLAALVAAQSYRLVILDTLARAMVGADENSARDMGVAVDAADQIRRATPDTAVLLVHHTGKDKTTVRGSSALEGAVDTVYATEGDELCLKLSRRKRKDGPRDDEHTLRLTPYLDSAYLETTSPLPADTTRSERQVLDALTDVFAGSGASPTQLVDATGLHRSTVYDAIRHLCRRGAIRNTRQSGRPVWAAVSPPAETP